MSTVTVDRQGPRRLRQAIEETAPQAARLVQSHMREPMPRTEIRLTDARGMANAVPASIGIARPGMLRMANYRRTARGACGLTLPTPDRSVLVLLRTDWLHSHPGEVATAIVHELVHAVQMGRPGIAEAAMTSTRYELGQIDMPRKWVRDFNRSVDSHEAEAYRIERLLAPTT